MFQKRGISRGCPAIRAWLVIRVCLSRAPAAEDSEIMDLTKPLGSDIIDWLMIRLKSTLCTVANEFLQRYFFYKLKETIVRHNCKRQFRFWGKIILNSLQGSSRATAFKNMSSLKFHV